MAEIIHIASGKRIWTDVTKDEAESELEILNAEYPGAYKVIDVDPDSK